MSHLPRLLPSGLLIGLLAASGMAAHARELSSAEPLRVTLVSLARQATSIGPTPGAKLSVRRAWASDSHAQLCALTLDAQGQPVLNDGRFQLRRVRFEQRQGAWRVQHTDTAWLRAGDALDAACPRSGGEVREPTQLAQTTKKASSDIRVAISEMERHPPTAGLPGGRPANTNKADAHCDASPATGNSTDGVTNEIAAAWPTGQIAPAGRSHLFTAPDSACPMGKHLVQNDKVRIGATQSGWTQVRYTHPITNVVTVGWLPKQKVAPTQAQVASATH